MEINGIAHCNLTVSDMERSRPFYRQMLTFLGMKPVIDAEAMLYCVGGRTAMGIQPADDKNDRFVQRRVGLHHVCFRAREREDVDRFYEFLKKLDGATVVHPPKEGAWAPGYYSVLFEDPDGIRLEMNHVPGRGLLEPGQRSGAARE
ncbi:MAG TPA: VOC family protein [Myxococcota bacterium]|nr:VOC family protein [Myxococcota bacterium]